MNSSRLRNGFVYLLILLAIGAILYSYRSQSTRPDSATITDIAEALKEPPANKGRSIARIRPPAPAWIGPAGHRVGEWDEIVATGQGQLHRLE